MRLDEISVDPLDNVELSKSDYGKILQQVKVRAEGDRRATGLKSKIMKMWAKGNRSVGQFKRVLKSYDIDIENIAQKGVDI